MCVPLQWVTESFCYRAGFLKSGEKHVMIGSIRGKALDFQDSPDLNSFVYIFTPSLTQELFIKRQLWIPQTVLAVQPLVSTLTDTVQWKDRQDTKNYTEKWIPLKLISHNDNEFSEEDFLGVLIVRRAQPRERTIKQGDDMSYEEGGPEGYGRGRDALFPQELQGEPREKTSRRLRVGGLSLFTIRI